MSDEGKSIINFITVLVFLGGFVGFTYKLFQESTVGNFFYISIIGVISCITIGIIFFSIYLFAGRNYLKQIVTLMYILLLIFVLLYFVSLYVGVQLPTIEEIFYNIILMIIILSIIFIIHNHFYNLFDFLVDFV